MVPLGSGIPAEIVREHVEKLTLLMKQEDVAATIVFHPSNMLAFTGTGHHAWDRLVCGAITADGEVLVICPAFERPGIEDDTNLPTIHTWEEHEDSYARLAAALRAAGVKQGRIGVDGRTWIDTWTRFHAALEGCELLSGETLLREVRLCKSATEIAALRAAHARGERIFLALKEMVRAGVTERGLQEEVAAKFAGEGFRVSPMVQTGPNGAIPHHWADDSVIEEGHTVVIDSVTTTHAYNNDLTRTFVVGEPSPRAKQAYQAVRQAQAAAIEAARPGLACGELDAIARGVIEEAGFGEYFTHRLGHGMGIECHEPPFLVGGNDETLRAGECVTIEPGIYVPGEFGIRIEDDILITEDGCEVIRGDLPTDVTDAFDR